MYKQQRHTMIKALRLMVATALLAVSLTTLAPARPAHAATITVSAGTYTLALTAPAVNSVPWDSAR
jgi:hypothetical protein